MRITRLKIVNYHGIELFEQPIPEHGVVVRGRNSAGKTSILRAIQAALAAQGIGPEDIRIGNDRAEILVDLDGYSVQRVITPKGSSLRVRNSENDTKASPQKFLSELLGTSPLDPLDLVIEKDAKKRRAVVLAALPTRVTPEHLERWLQDCDPKPSDEMLAHALTMHGLDAIAMLRRHFYDIRAAKNAELKGAQGRVEHLEAELRKQRESLPEGAVETVQAAVTAHTAALQKSAALKAQGERAKVAAFRAETTRVGILKLREEAHEIVSTAERQRVSDADMAVLANCVATCTDDVRGLKAQLAQAEARLKDALAKEFAATRERDKATDLMHMADEKLKAAQGMQAALEATAEPAPSLQDLADAETAEHTAFERIALAERGETAQRITEALAQSRSTSRDLEREAGRLNSVVDRLTNDAPRELISESQGIEGLTVDGDSLLLDGVSIDKLSGAEAMKFCVEVARRANSKSRILIVDGLERLDDDQLRDFVKMATADSYQLLATKVASGDVQIEAISIDPA